MSHNKRLLRVFNKWVDESGLSKAEIAERLGFSRTNFFHFLNGRRRSVPDFKVLKKFSREIRVDFNELVIAHLRDIGLYTYVRKMLKCD